MWYFCQLTMPPAKRPSEGTARIWTNLALLTVNEEDMRRVCRNERKAIFGYGMLPLYEALGQSMDDVLFRNEHPGGRSADTDNWLLKKHSMGSYTVSANRIGEASHAAPPEYKLGSTTHEQAVEAIIAHELPRREEHMRKMDACAKKHARLFSGDLHGLAPGHIVRKHGNAPTKARLRASEMLSKAVAEEGYDNRAEHAMERPHFAVNTPWHCFVRKHSADAFFRKKGYTNAQTHKVTKIVDKSKPHYRVGEAEWLTV